MFDVFDGGQNPHLFFSSHRQAGDRRKSIERSKELVCRKSGVVTKKNVMERALRVND